MINALSVDLEYWYSAELVKESVTSSGIEDEQIVETVTPILDLLDKHDTRATFFVLGAVAERYPELVRAIFEKGHEIASHGYSHRRLRDLGETEFEREIKMAGELLESITGQKPVGFRAPSFSVDNSTKWVFDVLAKCGFRYDSSVFPIKTMLYGVPEAPLYPYRPSIADVNKEDNNGDIVEFPMTVIKLGRNVPISGGFYFRALPLWFLRWAIKRVNQTRPAMFYLHPWETYPGTLRPKGLPFYSKLITYWGIGSALKKLNGLLNTFQFAPAKKVLELGGLL